MEAVFSFARNQKAMQEAALQDTLSAKERDLQKQSDTNRQLRDSLNKLQEQLDLSEQKERRI